jgi:uncharacterized protein YgbK (DUF1537 family)
MMAFPAREAELERLSDQVSDRLLLVSDDLTGSLDTAVQFSRSGVSTFVTTRDSTRTPDTDATVIAADTESRHLPPREAAGRVERCVHAALRAGIRRFYKKTDSTLRGNIGAELEALLRATGVPVLYLVPAFPDAGRITRGGVQYVDGIPLHLSRYSREAANPVREASVSAIIRSQSDAAVVSVPRGADPVPLLAAAQRPAILVFDAETNHDLGVIGERLAVLGPPPLLAGCAGFAAVVPALLGLERHATPVPVLRPPLLVVCGSLDEVSRSQVREAEARGVPRWSTAAADPTRAVADALRGGGAATLEAGESLAFTGAVVRRIVEHVPVGTLAVFGGDTAFGVLAALGVRGLRPLGEICQGVVVSRLEDGHGGAPATGMHLVTKAGGFGPVDVIQRIRDALDKEE